MCNRLGKRKRELLNPPVPRELTPADYTDGYRPSPSDFINSGDFAVNRPAVLYLTEMPDGTVHKNFVVS